MPTVVAGPRMWFMASAERPSDLVQKSAARLRLIRTILDLEQTEMAEACAVTSQRWSNWENGAHLPDVIVMTRASMLYGFTLDWIYKGSIDRMPYEFVAEIQRRRPDLVLGAPAEAVPGDDWDVRPSVLKSRAKRQGSRAA